MAYAVSYLNAIAGKRMLLVKHIVDGISLLMANTV
jgi:hypothetical protein